MVTACANTERWRLLLLRLLVMVIVQLSASDNVVVSAHDSVHFRNGFKIGEATSQSAIVWTRLTKHAELLESPHRFVALSRDRVGSSTGIPKEDLPNQLPANVTLNDLHGRLEGAEGQVRITVWLPDEARSRPIVTNWMDVDPEADYTLQHQLEGLQADARYRIRIEGRASDSTSAIHVLSTTEGRFQTAPAPHQTKPSLAFAVASCSSFRKRDHSTQGHEIYHTLQQQIRPSFFVHTGDIEYYDWPDPYALTPELARFKWNRLYGLPYQRGFHQTTASYFMKDDHDLLRNDCQPGDHFGNLTFEQGVRLFREQFPLQGARQQATSDDGAKPYRTFRWGQDLQVWLVEGREYRSPNLQPDGPDKTLWGQEQRQWFRDTVAKSNATFKVLISPTPVLGPDLQRRADNHANQRGFLTEGRRIVRDFFTHSPSSSRLFVVAGDRRWQYHSVQQQEEEEANGTRDNTTTTTTPQQRQEVLEFGTGPTSDQHAGGHLVNDWTQGYRYLRVGGGFLSVTVQSNTTATNTSSAPPTNANTTSRVATIVFRHHAVDGSIQHQVQRQQRVQALAV